MSDIRFHFPFFKSRQSTLLRILSHFEVELPPFPPQKYILEFYAQEENPLLAFYILKGRILKVFYLTLYSSISLVLYPSAYLPPNIRIRLCDIATAANLVLGVSKLDIDLHC